MGTYLPVVNASQLQAVDWFAPFPIDVLVKRLPEIPARERWLFADDQDCRTILVDVPDDSFEWPDVEAAARNFKPLRGQVIVQLIPSPTHTASGIALLSEITHLAKRQPDVGIVLAVGKDIKGRSAGSRMVRKGDSYEISSELIPLKPGAIVLVNWRHGLWIKNAAAGDFVATGDVRVFGSAVPLEVEATNEVILIPYERSILCEIDMSESDVISYKPLGDNVLIERDAVVNEVSGIYLPDDSQYGNPTGTVVAVGPYAEDVEVGKRVLYNPVAGRVIRGAEELLGLRRPVLMPSFGVVSEIP